MLGHAQPQVIVFRSIESGTISAEAAKGVRPHHHRGVNKWILPRQHVAQLRRLGCRPAIADPSASVIDDVRPAPDSRNAGIRVEKRDLDPETIGRCNVVGVHAGNHRRTRELHSTIERGAYSKMLLTHEPDAGIEPRGGFDNLCGPIGRPVIDDDQLEVRK